MSKKTVRWKRLGMQAGESKLGELVPRRAQGEAKWLLTVRDDWAFSHTSGKICCKAMGSEKVSRFNKATKSGTVSTPQKKWR